MKCPIKSSQVRAGHESCHKCDLLKCLHKRPLQLTVHFAQDPKTSWLDIAGRYGLDSIHAAKISEIVNNLTRSDISLPISGSG